MCPRTCQHLNSGHTTEILFTSNYQNRFKYQPIKLRYKEVILASVNVTSESKNQNKPKEYNFLVFLKPANRTLHDSSRGSGSSQQCESSEAGEEISLHLHPSIRLTLSP